MKASPSDEPTAAPKDESSGTGHDPTPSEVLGVVWRWLHEDGSNWLRRYWSIERPKSKWSEIVMVILTVTIAGAALYSGWLFQSQLQEARRATNLSETQWSAQQRPWIGLFGNVDLHIQPRFRVYAENPPNHTEIEIATSFKIKNFGLSPAFNTASEVEVLATENDLKLPQFQMETSCGMADGNGESEGNVIFPSGEITTNFKTTSGNQIELNHIRRIWVMACTSYQDGISKSIHHSKFWIMSFMIPEATTPAVVEKNQKVTIFTMPVTGWHVVKTEAD